MREERHYYAFISHSTKDEKIATWLRERLVNYNIPVSVQKEYNAPKKLRPIFLYQTDLAGNVLNESLRAELQDSHYLIVICSPSGAQSEYVNREVKHFIETGRAECIIPVIVDGTPHAGNPSEECFPPALLALAGENELRGVDLRDSKTKYGSKQGAVANIVASMLGVRFDILWNLYKRKRKRKTLLWSLLLLVLILGVLFVWDYKRPTYKYFVDYVDCWGVPTGIMPIDKKDVSHRSSSCRFEYHRVPFGTEKAYSWRVTKVCYVNSSMRLQQNVPEVEMRTRYPMVEVEYYKKTNVVSRLNFYDKSGKLRLRHNLTARDGQPALIADFVSSKEENGVGFENAELTAMMEKPLYEIPRKSNIVRYVYERDQSGHIIRQTFHHNNDYDLSKSIQCDAMGVFGKQFVLDSLGRPKKILYLDENGNNCPSKCGVS